MRIVRLANFITPHSGGLRTALRELGAGYAAAGHEPVLVMPGAADGDEETPQGRVITLRGPVLPLSGGYRLLLSKRRVRDLLESLRPDRLEVSDRTTLRWTGPWARRNHVPAVMVSHESVAGLLSLPLRSKWHQPPGVPDVGAAGRMIQGMARVLADTLNARTAQAYAQVVCTTRWAAAEFERLGVRNLRHVPLGVDLELFSPRRRCPELRRRYAAPGEVLMVHCGRLSVEKKPHRSIDALARLRAAGVPAVLVVAGEGPLRPRLERQAAGGGLPVVFAGFARPRAGGDLRPGRAGGPGVRHAGGGERLRRAARGDRRRGGDGDRRGLRGRGAQCAGAAGRGKAGGGPRPRRAVRLAGRRQRLPGRACRGRPRRDG